MPVQPEQKQIVKANKKIIAAGQPAEEFEPEAKSLNEIIETPADRTLPTSQAACASEAIQAEHEPCQKASVIY